MCEQFYRAIWLSVKVLFSLFTRDNCYKNLICVVVMTNPDVVAIIINSTFARIIAELYFMSHTFMSGILSILHQFSVVECVSWWHSKLFQNLFHTTACIQYIQVIRCIKATNKRQFGSVHTFSSSLHLANAEMFLKILLINSFVWFILPWMFGSDVRSVYFIFVNFYSKLRWRYFKFLNFHLLNRFVCSPIL